MKRRRRSYEENSVLESRKLGPYLLGPRVGSSPVKCVSMSLARKEGTDEFFTLKVLSLTPSSSENPDEKQGKMLLHTEHSLLSLLRGVDGVVKCKDFFTSKKQDGSKKAVLVTECLTSHDFCSKSSDLINLQHYVICCKRVPEKEALLIFYNIIKVVNSLHQMNVVHRDLKLGNVVLHRPTFKITLVNFCLAEYLMKESDLLEDQRGSPVYISPDVLSGKPYYGKPSDMWALGVVLFSMLYGQFPFYDSSPHELFAKIRTGEFSIPEDGRVSEDTKFIIKSLLAKDPFKRFTAFKTKESLEILIRKWKMISSVESDLQVVPDSSAVEESLPTPETPPKKPKKNCDTPIYYSYPEQDSVLDLSKRSSHNRSSPVPSSQIIS